MNNTQTVKEHIEIVETIHHKPQELFRCSECKERYILPGCFNYLDKKHICINCAVMLTLGNEEEWSKVEEVENIKL